MISDHEIFQKGYRPPTKKHQAIQHNEEMIPLREGFFEGLDILSAKEMKRKGNLTFLSKRQKMEMELARITEREEKLKAARAKKEADLALLDDE